MRKLAFFSFLVIAIVALTGFNDCGQMSGSDAKLDKEQEQLMNMRNQVVRMEAIKNFTMVFAHRSVHWTGVASLHGAENGRLTLPIAQRDS